MLSKKLRIGLLSFSLSSMLLGCDMCPSAPLSLASLPAQAMEKPNPVLLLDRTDSALISSGIILPKEASTKSN